MCMLGPCLASSHGTRSIQPLKSSSGPPRRGWGAAAQFAATTSTAAPSASRCRVQSAVCSNSALESCSGRRQALERRRRGRLPHECLRLQHCRAHLRYGEILIRHGRWRWARHCRCPSWAQHRTQCTAGREVVSTAGSRQLRYASICTTPQRSMQLPAGRHDTVPAAGCPDDRQRRRCRNGHSRGAGAGSHTFETFPTCASRLVYFEWSVRWAAAADPRVLTDATRAAEPEKAAVKSLWDDSRAAVSSRAAGAGVSSAQLPSGEAGCAGAGAGLSFAAGVAGGGGCCLPAAEVVDVRRRADVASCGVNVHACGSCEGNRRNRLAKAYFADRCLLWR